ncbi:hypothetical protein [Roseobacter weihaiensis]|uniref:hypothetical protein n=1 Tax=Roseobacter weihaiensis TaxID=2763262 RepID=UPI001D0AFB6B|nr:hypothetical protein [Roseobacter sp. H9]
MTGLSASSAREHPKVIGNAGAFAKTGKMAAIGFNPRLVRRKKPFEGCAGVKSRLISAGMQPKRVNLRAAGIIAKATCPAVVSGN